jgi:hypothetical protein
VQTLISAMKQAYSIPSDFPESSSEVSSHNRAAISPVPSSTVYEMLVAVRLMFRTTPTIRTCDFDDLSNLLGIRAKDRPLTLPTSEESI